MKINITGLSGEGKSTIATLIEKSLKKEGFDCVNLDFVNMHEDEQSFHQDNYDVRLESITKTLDSIEITSKNVKG